MQQIAEVLAKFVRAQRGRNLQIGRAPLAFSAEIEHGPATVRAHHGEQPTERVEAVFVLYGVAPVA
ncbi:hypothetical protein KDW20_09180 [Burkholderia cenocepacia]|nr:hypothetical protein [Burkholderia cenocepacia]